MENQIDQELQDIIDKAFIHEDCPVKRMHAGWRKEQLTKRLIAYLEKKLSNNVKPVETGS